ncbi:uncharacterized protein EV420DRAFT_1650657 [Desarmillaria tabescens]|uniref:HTH CENPB-type domain-containing protein n=1 Tax=Armillaria tabescens TaxID=1929756 RepID=A0AA39MNK7_ARMTA|nr:uncharacterized protein EV420DRAFT_1650657 [Desarmillaria tabescens]KAK0439985.1 hypothetical protein EV420DRAFT_1650657 [Desarmillaria tabescens]
MVKSLQAAKEAAEKEAQLQIALKAVIDSGLDGKGWPKLSLQAAAKQYDEKVLADWIKVLGKQGIPLSLEAVTEHASHIVGEEVSVNWA